MCLPQRGCLELGGLPRTATLPPPPPEVQRAKEKVAWVRARRDSDSYNQTDGKYQTVLSRGGLEPGAGDADWGGDLLGGRGGGGCDSRPARFVRPPCFESHPDSRVLILG